MKLIELLPETSVLLVFFLVLLAVFLYKSTRLPDGFPPGPTPWPIIGNLYHLNRKPLQELFVDYQSKYGNIVGFKQAYNNAVVLNSLELIKEAFVQKSQIFTTRPDVKALYTIAPNTYKGQSNGVIWENGTEWRDVRRFTLMSLRDFGVGKATVEQKIKEEAQFVCDVFSNYIDKPFDFREIITQAVSNIICSLCFGSRFEYSDHRFKRLIFLIDQRFRNLNLFRAINYFPILRFSPTERWFKTILQHGNEVLELLNDQVEEHQESFDPKSVRDFVDHYLKTRNEDASTFSRGCLLRTIHDLLIAGTETTSSTITWCILYLIHYPEIQVKCQNEIDKFVGPSRQVSLADRERLPYLDATIHEVQRLSTIAPIGVPHCASETTTLGGYTIPKGTWVYSNLHAVHQSSRYWRNPKDFQPERWLSSDGKFQKNPAFLVFSVGPRVCLGEIMARAELFLFMGNLLQQFTFKAVDPDNPPPLKTTTPFIRRTIPYEVMVHSR